jgi:hypothetical protein
MAERELRSSPSMAALFARAGVSMIPGASRLPFVGGGGGGGGGERIHELSLALSDVAIDRDRLVAYDRVCGFALSDRLPPTYPNMVAFPLHLALMTDGRSVDGPGAARARRDCERDALKCRDSNL